MNKQVLRSNSLLLITALIWGLAFVAQRVGIRYVGSFTFNGVRFALGGLSLIPLIVYYRWRSAPEGKTDSKFTRALPAGLIAGCILFLAASLQQVGLEHTEAGKAAFITGLYIVIVPIFGIFLKHRVSLQTWLGVVAAAIGLYFLSVTAKFTISYSDLLLLVGAFLWAGHILVIDHFSRKVDALKLSLVQVLTCAILSLAVAFGFEKISIDGIYQAAVPILYGGIASVGIAYTLQVVGQKHAKPSHAAIILSLETVFASLGGLLILHEYLEARGYLGCILMLTGMLLTQIQNLGPSSKPGEAVSYKIREET